MSVEHLQAIREYEIAQVMPYMKPGQRVLEIGAGMGWQAKYMIEHGLRVITLDISENRTDFRSVIYDGEHIPLLSHSVDVIYTSNVLEHINHIRLFQTEMRRVLKHGGCAIHVLPTASWRWWTSIAFYAIKLRTVLKKLSPSYSPPTVSSIFKATQPHKHQLFPERHGEFGTSLTELYTFSRRYWMHFFRSAGWKIEHVQPNRLFYTGYSTLASKLPLSIRRRLSYLAGSACTIYILR